MITHTNCLYIIFTADESLSYDSVCIKSVMSNRKLAVKRYNQIKKYYRKFKPDSEYVYLALMPQGDEFCVPAGDIQTVFCNQNFIVKSNNKHVGNNQLYRNFR